MLSEWLEFGFRLACVLVFGLVLRSAVIAGGFVCRWLR